MYVRLNHRGGFTAIDLIALLAGLFLIAALAGLLLPLFAPRRHGHSRLMNNQTQLRGIQQGMVTFAQSNKKGGNDGFFPGLDSSGHVIPDGPKTGHSGDGTHPGSRFKIMLDGNFFTPDYITNPVDAHVTEVVIPPGATDYGPVTAGNYSYAMLGILRDEKVEWKETFNTSAIVLSDRAIGTDRSDIGSIWNDYNRRYRKGWHGTVVRNDNSTTFESTAEFADTRYGTFDQNTLDHLFEDAPNSGTGGVDAFLVHQDAATAYSHR